MTFSKYLLHAVLLKTIKPQISLSGLILNYDKGTLHCVQYVIGLCYICPSS